MGILDDGDDVLKCLGLRKDECTVKHIVGQLLKLFYVICKLIFFNCKASVFLGLFCIYEIVTCFI